jgi:hypothetical protein
MLADRDDFVSDALMLRGEFKKKRRKVCFERGL